MNAFTWGSPTPHLEIDPEIRRMALEIDPEGKLDDSALNIACSTACGWCRDDVQSARARGGEYFKMPTQATYYAQVEQILRNAVGLH